MPEIDTENIVTNDSKTKLSKKKAIMKKSNKVLFQNGNLKDIQVRGINTQIIAN